MKKYMTAFLLAGMVLFTNTAQADMNSRSNYKYSKKGMAAVESKEDSMDFVYPVAIGSLAVIVTVAALAASSATKRGPTFSAAESDA